MLSATRLVLFLTIFVMVVSFKPLLVKVRIRSLGMSSAAPEGQQMQVRPLIPRLQVPRSVKIGSMFGLWYALNVGYNIYTKKVLNAVPQLSYSVAFLQLFLGMLYVAPLWITRVRKIPHVSRADMKSLLPISVLHLLTHLGAIVSLGAGAISFTSVVKAAEPAVSAFLSAVFFQSFLPIPVYLSLVPIMAGVAYASLGELSFSTLSFGAAMVSNFASAGRALVSKKAMNKSATTNKLSAADLYAVLTLMAAVAALPICLLLEGGKIASVVQAVRYSGQARTIALHTLFSALFYYMYNEVAYITLDKVAPVTHAVGNTIKRVVLIMTSVIVFKTRMTVQGAVGSAVAIAGVLLYSLAKGYYGSKSIVRKVE